MAARTIISRPCRGIFLVTPDQKKDRERIHSEQLFYENKKNDSQETPIRHEMKSITEPLSSPRSDSGKFADLGPEETASADYSLTVNGFPVFVYRARVSAVPFNQPWPGYQRPLDQTELASFAYWDMSAPVRVEILSHRPVKEVVIRPLSSGIRPEVDGNRIAFDVSSPRSLVVEVNGSHHALHLFANSSGEEGINRNDPSVRYFKPGVHRPGKMEMKSGETIFIAAGAVVHGEIEANYATDIRIIGSGILDGSSFERHVPDEIMASDLFLKHGYDFRGCLTLYNCARVEVRGVVLRDSKAFSCAVVACHDVTIDNVKVIGTWRYNADGPHIRNSQNVTVRRCFIRSFDDSIAVTGGPWPGLGGLLPGLTLPGVNDGTTPHATGNQNTQDTREIVVRDCVVWNGWGTALEIGAEAVADEICDIHFENCDIIHATHAALGIHNGGRAHVRNVSYKNIRIEMEKDAPWPKMQESKDEKYPVDSIGYYPQIIGFVIAKNKWSVDRKQGHIRGVRVENIGVTGDCQPKATMGSGGFSPICIAGYSESHLVEDVAFKNITINGNKVADPGAVMTNAFVKGVTIQ